MSVEIAFSNNPVPELPPSFNIQEVRVVGNRGACGGVEMSLETVRQVMEIVPSDVDVWTTNSPVNFPLAFEKYGERFKNAKGDISQIPDGSVLIISAHGASPELFEEAKRRSMTVIDTTCPFVLNEQEKVRKAAREGIHSVFIGEENHPETIGVKGQVLPKEITIFDPSKPTPNISIPDGAKVFAKTTNDPEVTQDGIIKLQEINPTIDYSQAHSCYALDHRFAAGKALVEDVDYWLVVGDPSSHNAKGIRGIADNKGIPSKLVRTPDEIDWSHFEQSIRILGVAAAASVPEEYTQRVLSPLRQLNIPVVELPQTVTEAHRTFRLPKEQLDILQQQFNHE